MERVVLSLGRVSHKMIDGRVKVGLERGDEARQRAAHQPVQNCGLRNTFRGSEGVDSYERERHDRGLRFLDAFVGRRPKPP